MTTGLFPHEILIDLKGQKSVSDMKFVTSNGKSHESKPLSS